MKPLWLYINLKIGIIIIMKTTFKIINGNLYEYDSNGKLIHSKDSNGYEEWSEFNSNGNLIHVRTSTGYETWNDSNGNKITKKQQTTNKSER